MKKINHLILIILTINSVISARQFPTEVIGEFAGSKPISLTEFLTEETIKLKSEEENLLPTIEDIIIYYESLDLLKKKRKGIRLTLREEGSRFLEEKKFQNKLKKLKNAMPDLIEFRNHLNQLLAQAIRLKPQLKTTQSLRDFSEDLKTIFNKSHKFVGKKRFIEGRVPEMHIEIKSIMNEINDIFLEQLLELDRLTR